MKKYKLWIRISSQKTAYIIYVTDSTISAKLLGEAQHGIGNVLSCIEID